MILYKWLTEVNFCLADKNGSVLWCNQVTPLQCGSYQTFNINMTFCVLLSEACASLPWQDNSVWQTGCQTILLSVSSTCCYLEELHIIGQLCKNAKRVSILFGASSNGKKLKNPRDSAWDAAQGCAGQHLYRSPEAVSALWCTPVNETWARFSLNCGPGAWIHPGLIPLSGETNSELLFVFQRL